MDRPTQQRQSHRPSAPAFIALILASAIAPASRVESQENPTGPEAPAAIRSLPADSANLLYVADPLPHLERLLTWSRLRHVFEKGALARAQRDAGRTAPDLGQVWQAVKGYQHFIPSEVAMGCPDGAAVAAADFMLLVLLHDLCEAAAGLEGEQAREDAVRLQTELIELLQGFRLPRFTVLVGFRREGMATYAHGLAAGLLTSYLAASFPMESEPGRLRITLDAGTALDAFAGEVELGLGVQEELDRQLLEAIRRCRVELELVVRGDRLVLTGGAPTPESESPTNAALGPLWTRDENLLVFGRWSNTRVLEAARAHRAFWEKWKHTPVGRRVVELDDVDFVGDFENLERTILEVPLEASFRLLLGDRWEWTLLSTEEEVAVDLRSDSLRKLVPAGVREYTLEAHRSLAQEIYSALNEFESRLSRQSLQAELEQDESGFSDWVSAYYRDFAELRKLLRDESSGCFLPGFGTVWRPGGKMALVGAERAREEKWYSHEFRDLPALQFALFARVSSDETARGYLAKVHEALVNGLRSTQGLSPRVKPEPGLREVDLGLGEPTFEFDPQPFVEVLAPILAVRNVRMKGDFRLHGVIRDGILILSTWVPLTAEILQARQREAPELSVSATGTVMALERWPGECMRDLAGRCAAWIRTGTERGTWTVDGHVVDTTKDGQEVALYADGVAEILGLFETVSRVTTQEGRQRREVWTLELAR